MTLTRKFFDASQCQAPGCAHEHDQTLYLHGNCHIGSPTWTYWDGKRGVLVVECAECRSTVAEIEVAP